MMGAWNGLLLIETGSLYCREVKESDYSNSSGRFQINLASVRLDVSSESGTGTHHYRPSRN